MCRRSGWRPVDRPPRSLVQVGLADVAGDPDDLAPHVLDGAAAAQQDRDRSSSESGSARSRREHLGRDRRGPMTPAATRLVPVGEHTTLKSNATSRVAGITDVPAGPCLPDGRAALTLTSEAAAVTAGATNRPIDARNCLHALEHGLPLPIAGGLPPPSDWATSDGRDKPSTSRQARQARINSRSPPAHDRQRPLRAISARRLGARGPRVRSGSRLSGVVSRPRA